MVPAAMTTFSEGLVMMNPVPLPSTAASIIKEAKKHSPGFAEILFDPESSCFKIIAYKKNMDIVVSIVLKFVEDNRSKPAKFVKDQEKIDFTEYDHLRYPYFFAVMPFRAINRDLAVMDYPINLAKIMKTRGWSQDEGSDQFQKRTGCAISSNLEGTTIYLGAHEERKLQLAQETLRIIIEDTVKQVQQERTAELLRFKSSADVTTSVPTKVAASFYHKGQNGSLIDFDQDDAPDTATASWLENMQRDGAGSSTMITDAFVDAPSEQLDTVSQLADKTGDLNISRSKQKHHRYKNQTPKKKKRWEPKRTPEEQLQGALNDLMNGKDVARFHWPGAGVSYNHVKQAVEANKNTAKSDIHLIDVCTEDQAAFDCNYAGLEKLGQANQVARPQAAPVTIGDTNLIDIVDNASNDNCEPCRQAAVSNGPVPDDLLD
ncbi:hypothetical protein HYQ45_017577 [Verticillium longisporum]|uniref:Uncharacterized protein n=1 Tax=Verticillium longisporum TaxID=100787 RepID=A0A0G4KMY1_VERLO|nr:hypothetical protein HYQ44_013226 [Verticillium longisporum]KAG7110390.1 hypothetical protein HYQ45_017577 [Verticillium longisporum]CRK11133.1 hypothetical protein BN1723_009268 [Verticillium longisporum]